MASAAGALAADAVRASAVSASALEAAVAVARAWAVAAARAPAVGALLCVGGRAAGRCAAVRRWAAVRRRYVSDWRYVSGRGGDRVHAYALEGLVRRAVLAAVEHLTLLVVCVTGGHVLTQPYCCRVSTRRVIPFAMCSLLFLEAE